MFCCRPRDSATRKRGDKTLAKPPLYSATNLVSEAESETKEDQRTGEARLKRRRRKRRTKADMEEEEDR